jgi:DNA-binding NarL/FixJ family response regulator
MGRTTRILIADDHVQIRDALRELLELVPDIEVVGEAGTGLEAVELVTTTHPDVLKWTGSKRRGASSLIITTSASSATRPTAARISLRRWLRPALTTSS